MKHGEKMLRENFYEIIREIIHHVCNSILSAQIFNSNSVATFKNKLKKHLLT